MARLTHGETIALVSDAGTPLISDPGYKLVRKTIAAGIHVSALPGPCAAIMALTLSGLPCDRFMFVGFLPSKQLARQKKLTTLVNLDTTMVFFESARRLSECLQDMLDIFGNRDVSIARELTKLHEEMIRGSLQEVILNCINTNTFKGELALVLGPPPKSTSGFSEEYVDSRISQLIQTQSVRDTVIELSEETGLSKRLLYNRALFLNKSQNNN
jgi:16S rRNA (cytidine1402-2'-O)-methyltransferase